MDNNLINLDEIKDGTQQLKKIILMYESALKEMETKINIISQEFDLAQTVNEEKQIIRLEEEKTINEV